MVGYFLSAIWHFIVNTKTLLRRIWTNFKFRSEISFRFLLSNLSTSGLMFRIICSCNVFYFMLGLIYRMFFFFVYFIFLFLAFILSSRQIVKNLIRFIKDLGRCGTENGDLFKTYFAELNNFIPGIYLS